MRVWALAALLLLAGCGRPATERVDPTDYDAFFLWAGVKPPKALAKAKTVYLLDGEVRANDNARLVPLRPGTPNGSKVSLWLTVRAERLDWQEGVYRRIFVDLARWDAAGNRLIGLQIDFDSNTRGLANYAAFLADLRRRLPARYRLSVTGLMDWSAQGDPAALGKLAGTVDEVVIQTYQGRHTIPGYESYMTSLARLPLPYRVALVEGGEWRAPKTLAADPEFKGYVVFLLPAQPPTASRN
ncbi:DUF3142 domain-containing protein [Novosphingobium sp. G106]|nr:DUF3142 domain-containing protein [Novosphingobium sp. G106]